MEMQKHFSCDSTLNIVATTTSTTSVPATLLKVDSFNNSVKQDENVWSDLFCGASTQCHNENDFEEETKRGKVQRPSERQYVH